MPAQSAAGVRLTDPVALLLSKCPSRITRDVSLQDQFHLAIRTAALLPPASKNRELVKFDANVITLTRLTLYHRNLPSMKNTVSVINTVLLFSCATLFQAKAATIDLPLYSFQ